VPVLEEKGEEMSAKITDEEYDRRKAHVIECLTRNPLLTRNHFKKAFGYQAPWLKKIENEGVKFGAHKPCPLRFASSANRRTGCAFAPIRK
jgi:hypothetical protein